MTKGTKTVICTTCDGSGTHGTAYCGTCLGMGHVETDIAPATDPIIDTLLTILPRLPYSDRKTLERAISDALFKGEVYAFQREAWEKVVDTLRLTEGE